MGILIVFCIVVGLLVILVLSKGKPKFKVGDLLSFDNHEFLENTVHFKVIKVGKNVYLLETPNGHREESNIEGTDLLMGKVILDK